MKKYFPIIVGMAAFAALLFLTGAAKPQPSTLVELPFVENGVLYQSAVDGKRSEVAQNVLRIVSYREDDGATLYLTRGKGVHGTEDLSGQDLWIVEDGATRFLRQDVIEATLAPDGNLIALTANDFRVFVVDRSGAPVQSIDGHAISPVFNQQGNLLAFMKLADSVRDGDSQGLFEEGNGIWVKDLVSGKERIVTGKRFAGPISFTLNGNTIYFHAPTELGQVSLWSVDTGGENIHQLTNIGFGPTSQSKPVPMISGEAIWSQDRLVAISAHAGTDEGIWLFRFSPNESSVKATRIADGDSPRWLVPDKRIAFRTVNVWRTIDIR